MKQRLDLSDEEIISYMDFDTLRKKQMDFETRRRNRYTLFKWLAPALLIISLGIWYYGFYENEVEIPSSLQKVKLQSDQSPPSGETIVPAIDTVLVEVLNEDKDSKQVSLKPVLPTKPTEENTNEEHAPIESTYIQAEPVDGYAALYTFLNTNLQYPIESVKDSIQGVQTISFIINVEGKPESIQFKESLGVPFEVESTRLIESMPPWKPATLNGKPVASKLVLPITFQIQTVKAKN